MDCFVAASTGALKGISFQDQAFRNLNIVHELKPKCDEITSMCWASEKQTELLTVQLDRQLKLYDTANNSSSSLFEIYGGTGDIKGVYMTQSKNIVSAAESGDLRVWNSDGKVLTELNAGNDLLVMVPDVNDGRRCATGGKENPLKLWDLEKGVKVFTAKNVTADSLQLRVPILDKDIRILSDSQNIITATGNCQFRLYDPRAQRRPVKEIKWLDEPITALSLCNSPTQFFGGNTRGDMGLFDLRNKMSMVCKYKGSAGSIRGIVAHPQSSYVASCSIDRFVRLHEINTKKLLKKVYCKVRLHHILMKDDLSLLNAEKFKEKEMDNYEDDWKKIEEFGEEGNSGISSESEEEEALWNDMKGIRDSEKRKHKEAGLEGNEEEKDKKAKIFDLKRKQCSKTSVGAREGNEDEKQKRTKTGTAKRKLNSEDVEEGVGKKKRHVKKLKRKWIDIREDKIAAAN